MDKPEDFNLEEWQIHAADLANSVRVAQALRHSFLKYLLIVAVVTSLLTTGIIFGVTALTDNKAEDRSDRIDRNARITRRFGSDVKHEHQVMLCFFAAGPDYNDPLAVLIRCEELVHAGEFVFPPDGDRKGTAVPGDARASSATPPASTQTAHEPTPLSTPVPRHRSPRPSPTTRPSNSPTTKPTEPPGIRLCVDLPPVIDDECIDPIVLYVALAAARS